MDATPEHPMLFNGPATEKTESLHDSARGTPEPLDAFHALVEDINGILGPSNGIDSADVDVEEIKNVMLAYQSNEQEWSKYAFADSSRAYTRNLVDRGNGKSNLVSAFIVAVVIEKSSAIFCHHLPRVKSSKPCWPSCNSPHESKQGSSQPSPTSPATTNIL